MLTNRCYLSIISDGFEDRIDIHIIYTHGLPNHYSSFADVYITTSSEDSSIKIQGGQRLNCSFLGTIKQRRRIDDDDTRRVFTGLDKKKKTTSSEGPCVCVSLSCKIFRRPLIGLNGPWHTYTTYSWGPATKKCRTSRAQESMSRW